MVEFQDAKRRLCFSDPVLKTNLILCCSLIRWVIEKEENSRKHLLLLYCLCQNLWLCRSQQTGKFWKRWEYQTTLPASWEICILVKKKQLETDMNNRLFANWERNVSGCILSICLFNLYVEYILLNAGWMKHKLGSRLLREIPIISDTQMTQPL